jgi:hypothetical protein
MPTARLGNLAVAAGSDRQERPWDVLRCLLFAAKTGFRRQSLPAPVEDRCRLFRANVDGGQCPTVRAAMRIAAAV